VAFGFAPKPRAHAVSPRSRTLGPDDWTDAAVPLLGSPRDVVRDLHARHLPSPATAVIAVYDTDGRAVASASFTQRASHDDGWEHRNTILDHLRRVFPHDLRLRTPVRTAVLLVCRDGAPGWTEADGAWMWGLRDACTLHGLRCGAYITLTAGGWQILGDGRSGRTPHSGSWAERAEVSAKLTSRTRAPEALRRQVAR
jgi:hypothetical protein